MKLDDIDRVHELDVLSFSMPWPHHSYRFELLENPHSLQWVAETLHEGQPLVVGMLVMWLVLDEAHIATIAVHPDFRRLGIGRQLMLTAMRAGLAQGATSATLEVRQHNVGAIRLYEQLGFEMVGRRPRYYQDTQEDALIMTIKDLAGALERLEPCSQTNG